jgi:hypothetical protein
MSGKSPFRQSGQLRTEYAPHSENAEPAMDAYAAQRPNLRIVSLLCYIPYRLDAVGLNFLQGRASLNPSANCFQY